MEYTDRDGAKKNPYIIHRTSIGCYERTLALILEKFAGVLPLWMAPEQARILPISDKHVDAAKAIAAKLSRDGIRVTVDTRDEKIGKKIRQAQMDKIIYMLVIGDKEVEENQLSVRSRHEGELGSLSPDELVARLKNEIATRKKVY